MKRFLIIPFVLLSFFSFSIHARSSIDVPLDDSSYHFIDLLVSHGLVNTAIIGHRPWSRQEMARLIIEARGRWESKKEIDEFIPEKKKTWIETVIKKLESQFKTELLSSQPTFQIRPLDQLHIVSNYLENPKRYFIEESEIGPIYAFTQPLVQYREGRDYSDGVNLSFETEHWAQLSSFTSWYFQPRFQLQFPVGENEEINAKFFVQKLYGTVTFWNTELQFGRSSLVFGQSDYGGFMLSNNALPLDHIHITNDRPFLLPWVLKYLGLNKWTIFYANMGPDFYFPYTSYAGYKLTLKPFKYLEIGFANELLMGGEGAPEWDTKKFILDFIGSSTTSDGRSDRILGFDGRLTLPFLKGSQLYGEAFFDDISFRHIKGTLINSAAYKVGMDLPRLNDSGTLYANIEAKYLPHRFYRHGQFIGGYTRYDHVLGDALGPDSWGISSSFGIFFNPSTSLKYEFFFEKIDGNELSDEDTSEKRLRFLTTLKHEWLYYSFFAKAGYEYINDYGFSPGNTKNNFLIEAGLTLDFDGFVGIKK